MHPWAKCKFC